MNLIVSFVMCFFMYLYIVRKFRKISSLSRYLTGKTKFFAACAVLSLITALFRWIFLGIATYLLIFYLFLDILGFFVKIVSKARYQKYQTIYHYGYVIMIISVAITVLSAVHVKKIAVVNYTIDLEKEFTTESVRLMLVTDLHLGTATNEATLDKIADTVNEEQPDYLILGGDIIDESTSDELYQVALDRFSQLNQEVDIIYILGNHEFIRNQEEGVVNDYKEAGITVLEDEVMLADQGFYFVGRTDKYNSMRSNQKRASLSELSENIDFSYPVILLDHQPVELKSAKKLGYDVVLSGHTHAGQFFPMTFFARFFNERLYGLDKEDSFYTIVSSGTGVWGMAIRNTSNSEIVIVDLK